MNNEPKSPINLYGVFQALSKLHGKTAYVDPATAAGAVPPGGAPMPPSGGAPMPPGAAPMPPGGMPMDPAMMGAMPPDPTMAGAPPMDPAAVEAAAPPVEEPLTADAVRSIVREEMQSGGGGEGEKKPKSGKKSDGDAQMRQVRLMLTAIMETLGISLPPSAMLDDDELEAAAPPAEEAAPPEGGDPSAAAAPAPEAAGGPGVQPITPFDGSQGPLPVEAAPKTAEADYDNLLDCFLYLTR